MAPSFFSANDQRSPQRRLEVGVGSTCGGRRKCIRDLAVAGPDPPGKYSSTTTWKLVPPKPKAETPACRTWPGAAFHSRSSVFT